MEQEGLFDDSRSITEFFKPLKRQIIQEKQKKKEEEARLRKNSKQMSIFGWLVKPRPKQQGKITSLSKNLIVAILGYLRIEEIVTVSQVCFYLNQCAKTIWNDTDYLGQLQTDQLSYKELYLILHKSGKLSHIKQLRNIYRGKNLKLRREKIKLKLQKSNNFSLNPISGTLLQVFEVSPKTMKSSTFLMDSHLQQIINSSFKSLTQIKLLSCGCLRKFDMIGRCTELVSLSITNNCFLSSDNLRVICKCCQKIEYLDVSGCEYLDQNIFKHFSKLNQLKTLIVSHYNQPFVGIQNLGTIKELTSISIENSCIMDIEAIQLVNSIQSLTKLDISGCKLLTDAFLQWLSTQDREIKIEMKRTQFSETALKQYEKKFAMRDK